jgi:hypothetical protein
MNHTETDTAMQEGIDPLVNEALKRPPATPEGYALVPVQRLRKHGASLAAIGLAAAMIYRDERVSTAERIAKIYGTEKLNCNNLLRQLIIAGFLREAGGLYHVEAGGLQ